MSKTQQIFIWGGVSLFLLGLLYLVSGILLPFFTSLLIAYAMSSLVNRLEKWGITRSFGAILVLGSFFLSLALLLLIVFPFIQAEIFYLTSRIPYYGTQFMNLLHPLFEQSRPYIPQGTLAQFQEFASTHVGDLITWGFKLAARILTNSLAVANLLSLIVITPLVSFYCLRDWEKIVMTLASWIPRPYIPAVRELCLEINSTLGAFVKGQFFVCVTVGLYYCIALTLADLDSGFVVGILIGVMAFIPYIGAFLGFLLSIGIALAQFAEWSSVGIILGVFLVGQFLEGYLFIPYFIGDRIGLHPVWVIFALLAGGVLYGFLGILFALPIAAALGVVGRYLLQIYFESPYYLGNTPTARKKLS